MTITTTKTAAEILTAAAERIETYGHLKGAMVAVPAEPETWASSPCCMAGAIRISAGLDIAPNDVPDLYGNWEDQPKPVRDAEQLVAEWVIRAGGRECEEQNGDTDPVETIAGWNDGEFCDAASAVHILREAAELAA